jgi:hypothetical protein
MKKVSNNLEHRIQIKQNEIENYKRSIVNYPTERMEKCGNPYLQKLNNELTILQNELTDRDNKKEIKQQLGYSRIGLNNI